MFDFVTQFPIENEDAKIKDLHEEAAGETRLMAVGLGYSFAGPPSFRVIELPLSMYLECRVPVQEIKFGGGRRGR